MVDDTKDTVSLEEFNALKEQISNLTDAVKNFQKLGDGLKKDLKSIKTTPTVDKTAETISDDPHAKAIADLRKQNEMLLKRDDERAARERDLNFTNVLRQQLTAQGVDSKAIEHAIIYTKNAGVARMDEEGNIIFKVGDIDYTNPAQGAKAWASTSEADLYKAPKGAKGSGQSTNSKDKNPVKTEGGMSMDELERQAQETLFG